MAELTIRPEEIRDALARFVQEYEPEGAAREEIGTVIECGDGIARVEGLPSAMASELLVFENGVRGLALNLDVREIGVVILGEFNEIEEGQQVKRTGEILSVPVGDGFLGRVVGPLGEPLDGKSIMIHAEQGLGDSIQFTRYASKLKELGARIDHGPDHRRSAALPGRCPTDACRRGERP